MNQKKTSWEPVEGWYNRIVGNEGHYYHQHVILPGALRMLRPGPDMTLLDLACGQGILARQLPQGCRYTGVDASPSLIRAAKKADTDPLHEYFIGDVTQPLPTKKMFSHATIILALQNIEQPALALQNVSKHLKPHGSFLLVLNHPCFRIPRQSSWRVDEAQKLQFRRVDRYMSDMKIPINAHPGQGQDSPQTWSFHHPLSSYFTWLSDADFAVVALEEWCSDKESVGKASKQENRARLEIPLFMAILAQKK